LALEVVSWPCRWRSCPRIGLVVHIFTFSRSPSGLGHGLGCKSVFFWVLEENNSVSLAWGSMTAFSVLQGAPEKVLCIYQSRQFLITLKMVRLSHLKQRNFVCFVDNKTKLGTAGIINVPHYVVFWKISKITWKYFSGVSYTLINELAEFSQW